MFPSAHPDLMGQLAKERAASLRAEAQVQVPEGVAKAVGSESCNHCKLVENARDNMGHVAARWLRP